MNPYSTHQTSNLYVYILLLSLAIFVQNVSSSNINQLGDSLPHVTVGNGNICSDIFDNSQCMFIHKALDVLIQKYEKKLKDSEIRHEKKLKDSELESENKIRAIQVESMQQIKEISAIFQDRFDLKHVEMDRKYKRLESQLLRNQNGQTTEQIISSHDSLTNFSSLSHSEESSAEKYQNHGLKHKEYLGNKTLPNLNKNYRNKRSHKIHKSADKITKTKEQWIDVDQWKRIGNQIHDFLISSNNDEKKHQAQRQARKFPDESYYYYQNDVQGEEATYKQAQEWEPTSTIQRNTEHFTNAEKLKSLIADGYEKLIGEKFGQPKVEERQDINDVLPAIDSFYTQATEFITANSVPLTFISTAGAISNLGFNAYQQDTINDVLDDLDSKKDLIDSIHNKVTELEIVMASINTVTVAAMELATENRKRHTNTDSSIGSVCALLDALYGSGITSSTSITAKSCCFVSHTDSVVGNFMSCLSNTALSASSFFSKGTVGSCDTSTDSCGSLSPE